MEHLTLALAVGLVLTGLAAAVLGWRARARPIHRPGPKGALARAETPVFLFDGNFMIDASTPAAALIADRGARGEEMEALLSLLAPRFPDLGQRIADLDRRASVDVQATPPDGTSVRLRAEDGMLRISLHASDTADPQSHFEALERDAQSRELDLLRALTRETPQLLWQEDEGGALTWANDAFLSYADRKRPAGSGVGRVWPGSRLFADLEPPQAGTTGPVTTRQSLKFADEKAEHWFDVTAQRFGATTLYFATNVNDTVRAEHARGEFLQTLAKTFAQLSTGLAIFDKQRRLTMFNPALLDMFDLPFAFMSTRPTLEAILDRLREMRKLPEPRNYIGWRDGFAMLETGESGGIYSERWHLPDGLTFRVTGRPHPDGAMAFLFEDISAEVSLTQRFRIEIETGQSVLDEIEDAIAVFSNANTLVMTNRAYSALWDDSAVTGIDLQDLRGALRIWRARSATTAVWRRIEALQNGGAARTPVDELVVLTNGRQLRCTAKRIAGGMTMVRFSAPPGAAAPRQTLRSLDLDIRTAEA